VQIVQATLSRVGPSEEQQRAYINKPDGRTRKTPLRHAVEAGQLDMVRLLLKLGARNVNQQVSDNRLLLDTETVTSRALTRADMTLALT
jgi:ankyrin repeat protein